MMLQTTIEDQETAAIRPLLETLRRALLGEVAAIEQMKTDAYPADLKKYLDESRRAKLQVVAHCDKVMFGRKKPRRKRT